MNKGQLILLTGRDKGDGWRTRDNLMDLSVSSLCPIVYERGYLHISTYTCKLDPDNSSRTFWVVRPSSCIIVNREAI